VEEETVDFAAATTAALKIPSPCVSQGRSFDEHTPAEPAELQMRKGDREEEEELMRVLNLSKAGIVDDVVDGSVSFDASQSHSSSNMEETPHSESFRSEAHEMVRATDKDEHSNHAVSDDGPVAQETSGAANDSEVRPEESPEALTSKESKDLDIPVQLSEPTPFSHEPDAPSDQPAPPVSHEPDAPSDQPAPPVSHEPDAPSDQPAPPAINEADKETCREKSDMQIHGQSTDIEVPCGTSGAACEDVPSLPTTVVEGKSDSLDDSEPLSSSIQEGEPIYQGEEHVLGTGNMAYENQEPVYEGEVVLAEQADKIGKSSDCSEDKDTEHQCENFRFSSY
jgi:ubiquitin carboxyl-terminal hydrolase MINDY-1/2